LRSRSKNQSSDWFFVLSAPLLLLRVEPVALGFGGKAASHYFSHVTAEMNSACGNFALRSELTRHPARRARVRV
jgi:hypothetical protein